MKKFFVVIIALVVVTGGGLYMWLQQSIGVTPSLPRNAEQPAQNTQTTDTPQSIPATTTIVENLDTPWGMALLPDGKLLVTERFGRVTLFDPASVEDPITVATLQQVQEIGEGGLLGVALHPDFASNKSVYLYYTYSGSGNNTLNRVVRMTLRNNALQDEQIIVDAIPGASNHNGGRIKFGPDGFLYIGTGDAQEPSQAQNTSSLAGKILRVTESGEAVQGNPFDNRVYSYGHRNVQGLAFDTQGSLWATEHGRSGAASGFDEVNLIKAGNNYGWPEIQGDEARQGMVRPVRHSGASTTWAPAGATILDDSLYFTGLRGATLYEAVISGEEITDFREHFVGEYGRLRNVITTPDGLLYMATSNQDGRGQPRAGDDKIIRVNPEKL